MRPQDYELPQENWHRQDCPLCRAFREAEPLAQVSQEGRVLIKAIEGFVPLMLRQAELGRKGVGIYDRMNPVGAYEIVIDSPEHGLQPEDLGEGHMQMLLGLYRARIKELVKDPKVRYVLVFKNRGMLSGASFEHPHSELIATPIIPKLLKEELDGAKGYYAYKERCIFCDILNEELRMKERIIAQSEGFVAFSPYAPRVPFEFWVLPRRHNCAFEDCTDEELGELAMLMKGLLQKMRRALREPPYNYYIHTAPNRVPRRDHWHTLGDDFHWHIEVLPRLHRTSGFEWGSDFYMLSTSPEDGAKYIREA